MPFVVRAIIPVAATLTNIILCLYLVLKKRLQETAAAFFVFYLLVTVLWHAGLVLRAYDIWPLNGQLVGQFVYLYGLAPASFLLWLSVRAFLQIEEHPRWPWGVIGLVLLLMALLDGMGPVSLPWGGSGLTTRHLMLFLGTFTWGTFIGLAAFTALYTYALTQSPRHRNRIQYLLMAILGLAGGQVLYLSRAQPAQDAGLLVHWTGAAIFTYIIIRQNLPDISTTLRKTLSFVILTIFTVTIYLLTIYAVQFIWSGLLSSAAAALLLTFTFPPMRLYLQRLLNRLLLGRIYDERRVVRSYSQAVNNVLDLTDLVRLVLQHLGKTFLVDRKALLLVEKENKEHLYFRIMPKPPGDEWPQSFALGRGTALTDRFMQTSRPLDQYTIDVAPEFRQVDKTERLLLKGLGFEIFVPIHRNGKLIGLIALGPKLSRRPYTVQDQNVLSTLAAQTAIALANAQLFDSLQHNLQETTRIKNLMDNVFASIGSGVITTDVEGQVTMLNRAAQEILDIRANGNLGKAFEEVFLPLSNTALPLLIRDVIDHENDYNRYEISPDLPGRGRVELSMSLAPLKDGRSRTQGVAIVVDDRTETKRLRAVQDMFRKYVSPAVVDRLPTDPAELQLGGSRQEVSILFADVRGFTAFSEKLAPEDLVEILNRYLSIAAQSILTYEGTLDKFMGDAVMAIFNAPLEQPDHALRAVRAAAAMQQAIADYHQQVAESRGLTFGLGIHVGEVVVGNIGTAARMDYTAVGDAVNLAKRLQENSPGGRILLSEDAFRRVADRVNAVPYRLMQLKGRSEAEQVYELLGVL